MHQWTLEAALTALTGALGGGMIGNTTTGPNQVNVKQLPKGWSDSAPPPIPVIGGPRDGG